MKIKIRESQAAKIFKLLEQTPKRGRQEHEEDYLPIIGPFRCILYKKIKLGGGQPATTAQVGPNELLWESEYKLDDPSRECDGKNATINVERSLAVMRYRRKDGSWQDGGKPDLNWEFNIRYTTQKCVNNKWVDGNQKWVKLRGAWTCGEHKEQTADFESFTLGGTPTEYLTRNLNPKTTSTGTPPHTVLIDGIPGSINVNSANGVSGTLEKIKIKGFE